MRWRSFGSPDTIFEGSELNVSELKAMNRAAILEFVAALKEASREDSTASVDEILARVDARMKEIHVKLNQLRLYEARRNLLDEYRSGAL